MLVRKTLYLSLGCALIACGKPQKASYGENSPQVQEKINSALISGILPSVEQVQTNTIPEVEKLCQEFKASLPEDYFQDTIEVPEDPGRPEGRKIKVFYYGILRKDKTPAVFFNGGPGSDSHSSYRYLKEKSWNFDINDDVGLVYIDQRGNGCSSPYPTGNAPETLERLRHYGSSGIVADAEAIRKKLLGDKKWIVYGQSYGAHIVRRYVINHPESVVAAVSHGNALNHDPFERMAYRLYSQHRVMQIYLNEHPDDKEVIEVLNSELKADDCWTVKKTKKKYCGYKLLGTFVQTSLGFHDYWDSMHSWLNVMVTDKKIDEGGVYWFTQSMYYNSSASGGELEYSDEVIRATDRNLPEFSAANCRKAADIIKTKFNVDITKSGFHDCSTALQFNWEESDLTPTISSLKKDYMSPDQLKSRLNENPKLLFYSFSGQKDAFVPVETYVDELARMEGVENYIYQNFPSTGHEGFAEEPKVWKKLAIEAKRENQ